MAAPVDYEAISAIPLPDKFQLSFNGKLVDGDDDSFGVINPATGKVMAQCPNASKAQLDEAAQSAKDALPAWRDLGESKRKELLRQVNVKMMENAGLLARVLAMEQGKPLSAGTTEGQLGAMEEIGGSAFWAGALCDMLSIPEPRVVQDDENVRVTIEQRPVGVVAGICPWNFPVMMAVWKITPACIAGCTIVVKPSPFTPLATLLIGKIYNEVLPAGVVNVLSGGNDLGAWMTGHDAFDKVSFTGSIATGKKIRQVCAGSLKRLTLERGGTDPAIILKGTDAKLIAPKIFGGAFTNSGQVCSAIKRIYVHEDDHDAFVKEFVAIAKEAKLGDAFDKESMYGPLQNKMQFDKVSAYVEDAKAKGAKIEIGGQATGTGYFYEPTVITGVDESFDIVSEEQFGPAVPIIKYSNVDDAVSRANSTRFGLGGSVWGNDLETANKLAAQLQSGTAWVNQHLVVSPMTPFGGFKESGLGRENGPDGLSNFLEPQTFNIAKKCAWAPDQPDPESTKKFWEFWK
jgi:acyl-CoA reductase-like NAD-dependent aldehyde dehydrogenase